MNIHSYDVLILAFSLLGLAVASFGKTVWTKQWVSSVFIISAGVLIPAIWFLYVLQSDKVFQNRAATLTYSSVFPTLIGGLALFLPLALFGIVRLKDPEREDRPRLVAGIAIYLATLIGLYVLSFGHKPNSYFLSFGPFFLALALVLVSIRFLATGNRALNLLISWALLAPILPYFPALFQRKLGMMMLLPWAILAALGLNEILKDRDRSLRNLASALAILLCSGSSIQWLARELTLIRQNVSNTTMHPVYLSAETSAIVKAIEKARQGGRRVVVAAPPGVWSPTLVDDPETKQPVQIVDSFETPQIIDLNPILVGLTGAKAYAGHWSETPDYGTKRADLARVFSADISQIASTAKQLKLTHLVLLNTEQLPADLSAVGKVVVNGQRFKLLEVD